VPAGGEPPVSALVVVANRGPHTLSFDSGRVVVARAAGGLAPSLAAALEGRRSLWIAAATTPDEKKVAARALAVPATEGLEVHLVEVPDEVAAAHRAFSNGTLWFLHHGLFDRTRRPVIDRRWHEAWRRYREYNALLADEVVRSAPRSATVVVNDYQLSLVGGRLADLRPDLRTVYFTHTPFCDPDELRILPGSVARELLSAIAGCGAAGFHTERWAENFRRCAAEHLVDPPEVVVVPLGVDTARLTELATSPSAQAARAELDGFVAGRRLIFRSDRLELSKNIVRGFLAFEELLEAEPDLAASVVFLAHLYPSREELPEYRAYRNEVERTAARLNERFGTPGRQPVALEIADDSDASMAALGAYDVLVVNALRDGMNLVAKEGAVLNRRGGVLCLSREAGAFGELGGASLAIEPFDVTGTAAVIRRALEMPAGERQALAGRLSALASLHPPTEWLATVESCARPARRLGPG
jgi:trehalose 6-phosphate synthase